jgi:hypothetical protein
MFKKGQSRNPAGKPKGCQNKIAHDIKAACQKLGPQLIEGLKEMALHGKTEAVKLAATEQLLSRGYGKPAQAITGADEGAIEIRHIVSWIGDIQPKVAPLDIRPHTPEDPMPWQH